MSSYRDTALYRQPGSANQGTWLSVDIISVRPEGLVVIERAGEPHSGEITLPGGLVNPEIDSNLAATAERIVKEKIGSTVESTFILSAVSEPGRDERGHTVSIIVLANILGDVMTSETIPEDMPFWHSIIAKEALEEVYFGVFNRPKVARTFFGEMGTKTEFVRRVKALERLLGKEEKSDASIMMKLLRLNFLESTGGFSESPNGRPAELWTVKP